MIFGKQDWGPEEMVALAAAFPQHLGTHLQLEYPFRIEPTALAKALNVISQDGEIFVAESVAEPLADVPSLDPRLVGSTITIFLCDARPVTNVAE